MVELNFVMMYKMWLNNAYDLQNVADLDNFEFGDDDDDQDVKIEDSDDEMDDKYSK